MLEHNSVLDMFLQMLYTCAEMMRHEFEGRIMVGTNIDSWELSEGGRSLSEDTNI